MALQWNLHDDGSFDLLFRDTVLIGDGYPAIEGRPVRVKKAGFSPEQELCYETEQGNLILSVGYEQEGEWYLEARLEGFQRKIHDIELVGKGICPKLQGFYQASGEMGYHCGYWESDRLTAGEGDGKGVKSAGLIGLQYPEGVLMVYAKKHDRFENTYWMNRTPEGICLSAQFRIEKVNQEQETLPRLYFQRYDTMEQGLQETASKIGEAMGARLHQPAAFHWCSWYYYYSELDQEQLEDNMAGFPKVDPNREMNYIQIDAGYFNHVGDWLIPRAYFAQGMQKAFDTIIGAGYRPGVWIGPFMVGNRSEVAKNHPDWLLKGLDGNPVIQWVFDNEPKLWGYQDEAYYILDSSHPEAMDYLRQVFRTMKNWGVQMFKTDFMLWGYQDSTKVRRYTPGKTSVEYFREVLTMIREEIGEESYWLGCIAPFFPFIGFADGMRIGGDIGSSWDGDFSPQNMMASVKGNRFANNRLYQIDPDSILLRDFHIRLTQRDIYSLALFEAFSGGCVYTSDPLHQLPEDRQKLFWFVKPDRRRTPRDPYLTQNRKEHLLIESSSDGRKQLVFVFNPTEEELLTQYCFDEWGLSENWYVSRFDGSCHNQSVQESIFVRTKPHGCHLILLSKDPAVLDYTNVWNNVK
ncbi:MAG: glycoside hydrolase family 36 protein [Massiliimalia sp.]|jgi:alpha-galactosidase